MDSQDQDAPNLRGLLSPLFPNYSRRPGAPACRLCGNDSGGALYGSEPGRTATPYAEVTQDQFEVLRNEIRHKTTGASFTSYPGRDKEISHINWSRCGDVLSNGEDYSRDEVGKIAAMLMAEQEITK
jgi:hypothetical protein